ncbi:GNAT family N-acetyltransferase [Mesorhizobium temperatum]|uniref:N-acetyltransferase domain-containing protein n=1 Tax=Mesorhizobium temperatum TaxID=241416 RepID=A0A271LJ75_9HYPH|nr:GNAT family N-acetyltransferase [Mesorhizobium temperatum]PAQ08134.1 hypothetical protein CIT26_19430 [Mesorhizobium temperatum]
MTVQLVVKPANTFKPEERSAFVELVKQDPQVNEATLPGLVDDAHFLAFLHLDGVLVGTNAIKNNPGYWGGIEEKAGVDLPPADYFAEVGYLHVAEGNRGKKLGDLLILGTFAAVKGQGLFATIQSTNIGSRRIFERHGFTQVGKSWPSTKVKDQLNLYIRPK